MDINNLTVGQIKEIQAMFPTSSPIMQHPPCAHPLPVGKNVIVRTVTMIYTGELVEVTPEYLVLTKCSWIPETSRWMDFVSNGSVNECEPYPNELPVFINRGSLLDICELKADLPRTQK